MSGCWDPRLDSLRRNVQLDTPRFAGIKLDPCLPHTLADASFLRYDTVPFEDRGATTNPGLCQEAKLLNIRQIFGSTVPSAALLQSHPA